MTPNSAQLACVDPDSTLCDTSSTTLNNESGVSSKHSLNVIQELKVEIEGIKRRFPPSNYADKDKELKNKLQNRRGKERKRKKKLQPAQVDVSPGTVEIPVEISENEIVDQQTRQPTNEVSIILGD